jgi:hypothetical protein
VLRRQDRDVQLNARFGATPDFVDSLYQCEDFATRVGVDIRPAFIVVAEEVQGDTLVCGDCGRKNDRQNCSPSRPDRAFGARDVDGPTRDDRQRNDEVQHQPWGLIGNHGIRAESSKRPDRDEQHETGAGSPHRGDQAGDPEGEQRRFLLREPGEINPGRLKMVLRPGFGPQHESPKRVPRTLPVGEEG